ncbi:dTDP-4-dehydrorhamnose reductase [Bradyrhizobium sp. HKCCYLS3077]|uniref:dTDP-4-dehydrorhamnose reductase n=1 Tax=Bradyrhizobium sp. HKCCYLS3077 TaxID=3420761 RepID=UPI003EB85A1F
MKTTRIYILGRQGQVARALQEVSEKRTDVVVGFGGRNDFDIADAEAVLGALRSFSPDVVVNPAAYTAVDRAEEESAAAFYVNRDGARAVAEASARLEIPTIHLSTDYVFDGAKPTPYVENDATAPINVYGASKLAGEHAVAVANDRHVILRTAWVYSPFGQNFVRTMLRLAATRDTLRVVDDQVGCPTSAHDIARAILAIAGRIDRSGWSTEFGGVTHIAGPDVVTWCDFARQIMRIAAARGARSANVEPITTRDYPTPARRPANSRLSCNRLMAVFGVYMPPLEQSLSECVSRLIIDEV